MFVFAEEVPKNTLELSIFDRVNIIDILPKQEGRIKAGFVSDIVEKIKLTKEEREEFTTITPSGRINWDEESAKKHKVIYAFTKHEIPILKSSVKKADDKRKIIPNKEFLALLDAIDALKKPE